MLGLREVRLLGSRKMLLYKVMNELSPAIPSVVARAVISQAAAREAALVKVRVTSTRTFKYG